MRSSLSLLAALSLVMSCSSGKSASTAAPGPVSSTATAILMSSNGQTLGEVRVQDSDKGVLITFDLRNVPTGTHGIHLHAIGSCTPAFDAAGAHFNPMKKTHGLLFFAGPHLGDLPNLHVPESGVVRTETFVTGIRLRTGKQRLLDEDGAAVVLHSFADDHRTDPSGGSGARIACGALRG